MHLLAHTVDLKRLAQHHEIELSLCALLVAHACKQIPILKV